MNRKHLLWHVFSTLDPYTINDMIDALEFNRVRFSDDPLPNEVGVAKIMRDKYEEYVKEVLNG